MPELPIPGTHEHPPAVFHISQEPLTDVSHLEQIQFMGGMVDVQTQAPLTKRLVQLQAVRSVGLDLPEAAKFFSLTKGTLNLYNRRIFRRLRVATEEQALIKSYSLGIFSVSRYIETPSFFDEEEETVIRGFSAGLPNRYLASALDMQPARLAYVIANIYDGVGVHNRISTINWAILKRIIVPRA